MRPSSSLATAVALLVAVLVSGCGVTERQRVTYEPEEFDSTTTHTRSFIASEAQTCEAARRALLSQGYMITAANVELVTGRKSFQPATEVHVEVEFRVVCAREGGKTRSTIAFASALQDRYGVKKVNNSASVGVGAIGSLSLPFSSSDDAMVKVASETLTDDRFYDRFFSLIERYLPESVEPVAPAEARPVPSPRPPVELPLQLQSVPLSPSRG
ncbi:MAG: DUF2242 domain-containing protein [Variovorax sp.]|nr:DUF2242 domain-containing protein [Variovorax sp.]